MATICKQKNGVRIWREIFDQFYNTNFSCPATLKAAYISPVVWNMQAFDSLVVDDDTKELVKALVTNQLDAEKSTDLIDGKGNSLVILLHGFANFFPVNYSWADENSGPGTGKTLTAGKY